MYVVTHKNYSIYITHLSRVSWRPRSFAESGGSQVVSCLGTEFRVMGQMSVV
jgi:hypothetical protein